MFIRQGGPQLKRCKSADFSQKARIGDNNYRRAFLSQLTGTMLTILVDAGQATSAKQRAVGRKKTKLSGVRSVFLFVRPFFRRHVFKTAFSFIFVRAGFLYDDYWRESGSSEWVVCSAIGEMASLIIFVVQARRRR